MVLLIIIFVFMPGLSSKSSVNLDKPESISVAADAIGMYLKKIANKELFVLKMQEIFDANPPVPPSAKSKENVHSGSAEQVLETLVTRVTKRIEKEKYKIKEQHSIYNNTFSFINTFELPKRHGFSSGPTEKISPICQKHFQLQKQNLDGCDFGDQTVYYTSNKTIYDADSIFDLSHDKIDSSVTSKFAWIINKNYIHYLSNAPVSTKSHCKERKIKSHHLGLLSSIDKQESGDLFVLVDKRPIAHRNMKAISQLGKAILTSASAKGKFRNNSIGELGPRSYLYF